MSESKRARDAENTALWTQRACNDWTIAVSAHKGLSDISQVLCDFANVHVPDSQRAEKAPLRVGARPSLVELPADVLRKIVGYVVDAACRDSGAADACALACATRATCRTLRDELDAEGGARVREAGLRVHRFLHDKNGDDVLNDLALSGRLAPWSYDNFLCSPAYFMDLVYFDKSPARNDFLRYIRERHHRAKASFAVVDEICMARANRVAPSAAEGVPARLRDALLK
jgi:hypothetical protein